MKQERKIVLEIGPGRAWWDINLKELWSYRDLISLFVRRDFVAFYKQTVLGPLWYIIQPALTTGMFIIIFNRIAGIPTDGVPPVLFYMAGLVVWNYFSQCLISTSNTFIKNANIFGKVYFPRMVMPIATIISNLISFGIQFFLLAIIAMYYAFTGWQLGNLWYLLWLPLLILTLAALGLGLGLIVCALTTKYRDLSYLVSFGVQLVMYGTPVIYSVSAVSDKYKWLILCNPLSSLMEAFRYIVLGSGYIELGALAYSVSFAVSVLVIGLIVFNRTEKNFLDVI